MDPTQGLSSEAEKDVGGTRIHTVREASRNLFSFVESPLRGLRGSLSRQPKQQSIQRMIEGNDDIPRLKIVVLGDYAVGKTSLIRQLTQRRFAPLSGTTIGVEFHEYVIQGSHNVGQASENKAVLHLWDVAGQQYSSSMTRQYYRWAAGAIVCADVTRRNTFDTALEWQHDVLNKTGSVIVSPPRLGSTGNSESGNLSSVLSTPLKVHKDESALRGETSPPLTAPVEEKKLADTSEEKSVSSSSLPAAKNEKWSIPIFLFATKADLLSTGEITVSDIYNFAMEHNFTDALITSATDHPSVLNAFEHITDIVLEERERLFMSPDGMANIHGGTASQVNLQRRRLFAPDASSGVQGKNTRNGCCF